MNNANVTAYAAFEGGKLARAVFVNLGAWLQSSTGTRPSVHIGFGTMAGSATLRRLAIQHADDTANLTWAGQSFETADVSPAGSVVTETVVLSQGFDIHSTEAVLLNF